MYNIQDIEKELSLLEIKSGIKLFVISLLSIQFIFQLFAFGYTKVISSFQITSHLNLFSPRELSSFATDMWLMVTLLSFFMVGYSIIKKAKDLPLYLLIAYPSILIILSMVRNVSFFQIVVISLLSCAVVLRVNFIKAKQVEFADA